MPAGPDSDADLVVRAARGDDDAFRTLYRAYAEPVYRVAFAILRDVGEAEELTQETFVTAWRKLRGLRLEGPSALPWLAAICRNHGANRIRSRARERAHVAAMPEGHEHSNSFDLEGHVVSLELARRIAREVEGLDAIDREIFVLCATQECSYDDAAAALGVTRAVVRNRLSRVRARLRTVAKETNG